MRILFLIHCYPPDVIGGHEVRCQRTVEGLRARGHEVLVLTTYRRTNGPSRDGHVLRVLRSKWSEDPNRTALKWVGVFRHNVRRFHRALREFRPEVICQWNLNWCTAAFVQHVHETAPAPVVEFPGGEISPVPDDLWYHYCRTPAAGLAADWVKRATVAMAGRLMPTAPKAFPYGTVSFPSPSTRDFWLAQGAQVMDPGVVYSGIDLERFPGRSGESYQHPPRFLFVGRLGPEKDPITVLEAFARVQERKETATRDSELALTVVAGTGLEPDYEQRARARIEELTPAVQLHEMVPPSEMPGIYAAHEVLIISSDREGGPQVLYEAWASGLAVLSTRCGGPDEILADGENCLTFPFGDADALAAQMERLITDPELVVKLGQAGRRLVEERFTLDRYIGEVERLLESTIARADR